MSLLILQPGLLTTVQDGGRWGHQKEGVIVSGAMDLQALRIANLLVGNAETAAALEINMPGPRIRFEEDHLIAISGADFSPTIDETPIRNWRPVRVKKGAVLHFGAPRKGRFVYLAVAGSFALQPVLNSTSTYLRASLGGFGGRALQSGDLLPCSSPAVSVQSMLQGERMDLGGKSFADARWTPAAGILPHYSDSLPIRMMKGPEWNLFSPETKVAFWQQGFTISSQSDRMGYRLEGTPLSLAQPAEILSSAVAFGTVQVPPGGQPIVLLADHQTTGGYPRIGQLASVDFSKLVQLQPGKSIRFTEITVQEAQQLYIAQEQQLHKLKIAIDLNLTRFR